MKEIYPLEPLLPRHSCGEVPVVTPPDGPWCATCFRRMLPVDRGLFSTCRACWERSQRELKALPLLRSFVEHAEPGHG